MSRDPDSFSVKLAVLGIIIVAAIIFYPSIQRDKIQKDYDELQEKYDDLEAKYDSIYSFYYDNKEDIGHELDRITESIGSLEDDIVTVWCYFEKEEGVTFDEAYSSFDKISTVLTSIIYPSR